MPRLSESSNMSVLSFTLKSVRLFGSKEKLPPLGPPFSVGIPRCGLAPLSTGILAGSTGGLDAGGGGTAAAGAAPEGFEPSCFGFPDPLE